MTEIEWKPLSDSGNRLVTAGPFLNEPQHLIAALESKGVDYVKHDDSTGYYITINKDNLEATKGIVLGAQ